jgi:hypothetical protein
VSVTTPSVSAVVVVCANVNGARNNKSAAKESRVFKTLPFDADLRTGKPAILKSFIVTVLVSEFSEVKADKPFLIEVNQRKHDAKEHWHRVAVANAGPKKPAFCF